MLLRCAALAIIMTGHAVAQPVSPPTEGVTVTATKSREVITRFVESVTTTARMTGKIARWETAICPVVVGLRPSALALISQRLRQVANDVGAPVSSDPSCKPNIEIVFTTTPQALANKMARMIWAMMMTGEHYREPAAVPA